MRLSIRFGYFKNQRELCVIKAAGRKNVFKFNRLKRINLNTTLIILFISIFLHVYTINFCMFNMEIDDV